MTNRKIFVMFVPWLHSFLGIVDAWMKALTVSVGWYALITISCFTSSDIIVPQHTDTLSSGQVLCNESFTALLNAEGLGQDLPLQAVIFLWSASGMFNARYDKRRGAVTPGCSLAPVIEQVTLSLLLRFRWKRKDEQSEKASVEGSVCSCQCLLLL